MKKLVCIACALLTVLSLTECNTYEQKVTSLGETSDIVSESSSEQQTSAQNESSREFTTLTARPVEVKSDMLILQDPENQQYGLYDSTGKEILPCKYGDMKFITVNNYAPKVYVAAQSKGSYGIYDLNGTEIVAPTYDDITEGTAYADGIIVEKSGTFGMVDLQGKEIIPVNYSDVASSPKGILGAVKKDGTACTVDLYASDGTSQGSFQTELTNTGTVMGGKGETDLMFFDGGNKISIKSDNGSNTYGQNCTLDGTAVSGRGLVGVVGIDGNYFESWNGSVLSFTDNAGKEVTSIEVGEGADGLTIMGSLNMDEGNKNLTGIVTCTPINSDFQLVGDSNNYLVTLGTTSSITLANDFKTVGPFYNGSAFAVKEGKIFVLDSSGNATELVAPFNAPSDAYLLYEGCAVLNNNGYIYVVDKDGNTILSEDGYTAVDWTYYREEGLIILTASDGTAQLIDAYGNEIIPKGNSYQQKVLYNAQGEDIEIYSLLCDTTAGKYIFVDNENLRAFETHNEMSEDFAQKLTAGQGWVLWDDTEQKLFAVVSDKNGYQICDVAGLSK